MKRKQQTTNKNIKTNAKKIETNRKQSNIVQKQKHIQKRKHGTQNNEQIRKMQKTNQTKTQSKTHT